MTESRILAIDQGTSSSRALVFDEASTVLSSAQQEFRQHFPKPGWVEHDPEEIWSTVRDVAAQAMAGAGVTAADVAAIGITNQRETTCVWERSGGRCIYNAIVWQDRRTAARCAALRDDDLEGIVADRTGLRLDPYFSASKIAWILDNVDGARSRAEAGELAFGTIDSFLLWRLTGGAVHATDATNASRTALFNIHDQDWDDELLDIFGVPRALLPEVFDCAADFGSTAAGLFDGGIAIRGVAGDQQAALIGQACIDYGMTKSTYGTGCFVIANTGGDALVSRNQLLTTIACRLDGRVTYGLEGSVFVAGSAIKWLRDELGIVESAASTGDVARRRGVVDDVWVVPAFAGLGAPWWDPDARGAILGLSRGSNRDDIVTATLQAVAYQTRDLMDAMRDDGIAPSVIRVDGGMVGNDWFLQFLADVLAVRVERPVNTESTVLGAALLAALATGIVAAPEDAARLWRPETAFEPRMRDDQREALLSGWRAAVDRVRGAR